MISYLKYPLWTAWRYIVDFPLAARNTGIVLAAFWRTGYIGFRIIRVLKRRQSQWSEKTRGRYTWRVARKFWACVILDMMGVRMAVRGRHLVDWSRPHIIVANHQSTVDILMLVAAIPNGRYVAKKEVLYYPFVGPAARYGGQIVIDRSDHQQAMAAIRDGVRAWPLSNLIFFAEGTRTRTGKLGEFKRGAFAIAKEVGLPIVPVAITGTYEALRKGSLLRLRSDARITVKFGVEISPNGGDVLTLTKKTRDAVARMIACEYS